MGERIRKNVVRRGVRLREKRTPPTLPPPPRGWGGGFTYCSSRYSSFPLRTVPSRGPQVVDAGRFRWKVFGQRKFSRLLQGKFLHSLKTAKITRKSNLTRGLSLYGQFLLEALKLQMQADFVATWRKSSVSETFPATLGRISSEPKIRENNLGEQSYSWVCLSAQRKISCQHVLYQVNYSYNICCNNLKSKSVTNNSCV